MDQNEFKLRQALLGENGVVARFHQQIADARQPNIPHVYVVINRQRVKISKTEISRWLRSTSYFRHLSHLKTDNQFLEAVYNDPSLNQLAQRPERVLSPNIINTLVAMAHLNEPDQDQALKEMVDQEEEAKGKLDYISERNETVNQALKTQLEKEQQSEGKTDEKKEETAKKTPGGSSRPAQPTQPTPPGHTEAGEISLDRSDLSLQRITSTQLPQTTQTPLTRQPFFRRITSNLSPKNTPSLFKNIASKGQILVSRVLRNPMVVSSLVGGLAGGALGLGVTGTAQGGIIGSLAGGSLPMASKTGALRGLLGLGGKGAAGLAGRGALAAGGPTTWPMLALSLAPTIKSWIQKYGKWIIATVVVILFLFFVLIPMNLLKTNSLFPPFQQDITGSTTQNRVIINKTGTREAPNEGTIIYTISVTYQGAGIADITVTDILPQTTRYSNSSEEGKWDNTGKTVDEGGGIVTWTLKGLTPGAKKDLNLTVQALPTANDSWVTNQAEASITNTQQDTNLSCDQTGFNLFDNNAVTDDILNNFIQKELNGPSVKKGSEQQSKFAERARLIRDTARDAGLNPALFLGLWRTESSFSIDTTRRGNDFGCRPNHQEVNSFEESLLCAVGKRSSGKNYTPSATTQCALSRDANSQPCQILKQPSQIEGYTLPIATLEDYLKAYGPLSADPNNINTHKGVRAIISGLGLIKCSSTPTSSSGGGDPTICGGTPVDLGVPKKLLPLPQEKLACQNSVTGACGRPGTCVSNPTRVVLHTTGGGKAAESITKAETIYQYFANSPDGRGVGSHFAIGKGGEVIQMVETLEGKIEMAYAVANYADHISIEIIHAYTYNSKDEMPPAQYQSLLNLVKTLMGKYNIPVGNLEYTWKASSDRATIDAAPGIYGHYQLNPLTRGDPGAGLIRDIREDLKKL